MEKSCAKKGFTLIEILIVLTIIGVLSGLAVSGYVSYRRSALIDLSVDNFVSQVEKLRSLSVYGEIGREKYEELELRLSEDAEGNDYISADAKCFGYYFKPLSRSREYELVLFSQRFSSKKTWNLISENWDFFGCGDFDERSEFDAELDDDIYFVSDIDLSDFLVRFFPPNGEAEFSLTHSAGFRELPILMRYGEGEEYTRELIVDMKTGRIRKNI